MPSKPVIYLRKVARDGDWEYIVRIYRDGSVGVYKRHVLSDHVAFHGITLPLGVWYQVVEALNSAINRGVARAAVVGRGG